MGLKKKKKIEAKDLGRPTLVWALSSRTSIGSHGKDMRKITPGSGQRKRRLIIVKHTQKISSQQKPETKTFLELHHS